MHLRNTTHNATAKRNIRIGEHKLYKTESYLLSYSSFFQVPILRFQTRVKIQGAERTERAEGFKCS